MKKWTDLLVFELDRIRYGYLALIGAIAALQGFAVFQVKNEYMKNLRDFQRTTHGNILDYLNEFGSLKFMDVVYSSPYIFSISLGVIALLLYAFVIWYRDWLGKNSFSYRVLTLPGSRMSVFFAKWATILFMVFGLLAVQLGLMFLGEKLLGLLVPGELYQAGSIHNLISTTVLFVILPTNLIDFILHYSLGIALLTAAYMMILLHLSFKWKGLVLDLLLSLAIFFIPVLLTNFGFFYYLYPAEVLLFLIASAVILFIISVAVSRLLLERKITA